MYNSYLVESLTVLEPTHKHRAPGSPRTFGGNWLPPGFAPGLPPALPSELRSASSRALLALSTSARFLAISDDRSILPTSGLPRGAGAASADGRGARAGIEGGAGIEIEAGAAIEIEAGAGTEAGAGIR